MCVNPGIVYYTCATVALGLWKVALTKRIIDGTRAITFKGEQKASC